MFIALKVSTIITFAKHFSDRNSILVYIYILTDSVLIIIFFYIETLYIIYIFLNIQNIKVKFFQFIFETT